MIKVTARYCALLMALAVLLTGCAPRPPAPPLTLQDVAGRPAPAGFVRELRAALARLPRGRYGWDGFIDTENGNYNGHTCQYCKTMITFTVHKDQGRYRGRVFTPLFAGTFYYAGGRLYWRDRRGWHLRAGRLPAPDPLGALRDLAGLAAVVRRLPSGHVGPVLCRVYALDTTADKLPGTLRPSIVLPGVDGKAPTRIILWIGYGNRGPYRPENGLLYRVETYTTVPAAGRPGIWQAVSFTLDYQGEAVRPPRLSNRAGPAEGRRREPGGNVHSPLGKVDHDPA